MQAAGRTVALFAILALPVPAGIHPRITMGAVAGRFFANPSQAGGFTATPASPVVISQRFASINFNPPQEAIHCTNPIAVNEWQRPMADVLVRADGSCGVQVVGNGSKQAGVGDLEQFNAVFTGTFAILSPGQVTFNIYADDGWILGIGRGSGSAPSYIGGPREGAPDHTPFARLPVIGAYNLATAPVRHDLVVNFPVAGAYDFELDYSECCGSQLALTMTADALAIAGTSDVPFTPVAGFLAIVLAIWLVKKLVERRHLTRTNQISRRGFAVRVAGDIHGGGQTAYRVELRGSSDWNPGRNQWDA